MNLILLAEDNVVNCKVIQEQLRILGYASEAAKDGQIALQMWRSGRFSLLLTDCNMPVMDGFELAETIRRQEQVATKIPIVAVTANVTRSDVERCLASGMNDYLSKPLRLNELAKMLEKWLPAQATVGVVVVPETNNLTVCAEAIQFVVWDIKILQNLVGDDADLQRSVLADFQISAKDLINDLSAAMATGNAKQVGDEAHKLKSASRTVGAMQLGDWCQKIEVTGRAGDMQSCKDIIGNLNESFTAATGAIAQYLG